MMNTVNWKAEVRARTGKGPARRARVAGRVPVTAYGKDTPAVSLSVDDETVDQLVRQKNWQTTFITLECEGAPGLAGKHFMIREVQRHHVSYKPLAVDLLSIRMDQKIRVDVPVEVRGGGEIKKQGGILEILHRSLPVKCLPANIPALIVIDAGHLLIGHSLHLGDVTLPEGIEVDLPRDYPLCTAVTVRAEEEAKPAAEAAAAEGAEAAPAEGEKKEEPKGKDRKEEKSEKK